MGNCSSKYKIVIQEDKRPVRKWHGAHVPKGSARLDGANFEAQKPLGKGKFGVVYLCRNKQTKQYYAVKYVAKSIMLETKARSRIEQELAILQRMDHPFILKYFGGFETESAVGIVTEFAVGGELYTRMKQNLKMPEVEAKFYAAEIALALNYLHNTMSIVYRDLKPENILIDSKGHIKLCDLGFAANVAGAGSSKKRASDGHLSDGSDGGDSTGSLSDHCGTAMYVAPEIAGGRKGSTHGLPVDWWSYGCVIYEMITGKPPFGDTAQMNKFEIFNNINAGQVSYPLSMKGAVKNLVKGLLEVGMCYAML
jgi:protein kinase A